MATGGVLRRRIASPSLPSAIQLDMVMALVLSDRCALLPSVDSALPQSLTVRSTHQPSLIGNDFY
jgi:hypothetical protein